MCVRRTAAIVNAMTETMAPPPSEGTQSPRLARTRDDRVVAGVCAALGRYTNVDPVIYRVTLAVLTIFGGLGVALYIAGWLLIPEDGEPESAAERFLHRHRDSRIWWIAGAGIALIILFSALDHGHGAFPALVIAGLVVYLVRREHGPFTGAPFVAGNPPVTPESPVPPVPPVPPAHWPTQQQPVWQPPPKLRRPKRERSKLGLVTLSVAVMVTGFLIALRQSGADGLSAERILAAALLVLAGGLLVGVLYGRARWLIVIAVPLSLALIPVSLVNVPITGGTGDRTWVADAGDSEVFRLGIGEATLVMQGGSSTPRSVDASVGIGHLLVLVPDGVRLELIAQADIGAVRLFGQDEDGTHVGYPARAVLVGPEDGTLVRVVAKVGIGMVEVRNA